MAFIQITQIKGGQTGCYDYFYKENQRIVAGQAAYVPDDELQRHLSSQLVSEVSKIPEGVTLVNAEDMPAKGK